MLLFYTGSDSPSTEQKLPEKSLGGYVSSSIVPNGLINNVFSSFTNSDVQNKESLVRVLALKNLTGADISSISIYPIIDPSSYITIQLGVAQPFFDLNGIENYERLSTSSSLPYYTTFSTYDIDSPLIISTPLINGRTIGIFILRQPNLVNIPNFNDPTLTGEQVEQLLEDYSTLEKEQTWNLSINW